MSYITAARAEQIIQREQARRAASAIAAPAADPYTSAELRARIDAILRNDLSRGRERLALALVTEPRMTIPQALAALRVAARDVPRR
jgi:hypothetical protein